MAWAQGADPGLWRRTWAQGPILTILTPKSTILEHACGFSGSSGSSGASGNVPVSFGSDSPFLPHAAGARMTVVKQTSSN